MIDQFAHHHRELADRRAQIEKVLAHEEESFSRTLSAGMARFQALVEDLAEKAFEQGETVVRTLPGREVFRLYDTYGFPFDLTLELAREQGLEVDQVGFEEAFAEQRETSRGRSAMPSATEHVRGPRSMSSSPKGELNFSATGKPRRMYALSGSSTRMDRLTRRRQVMRSK